MKRWLAALGGHSKRPGATHDLDGRPRAWVHHLAYELFNYYKSSGDFDALSQAVSLFRQALSMTPAGHPDRAGYMADLGVALRRLFERTGDLEVLTEAVDVGRKAVTTSTATDHSDHGGCLSNLGNSLRVLFEQTGELAVLSEAVHAGREAISVTPTGHPDHAGRLSNLGTALWGLFERTQDSAALAEVVDVWRNAVAITPTDHPGRAGLLTNLGISLQIQFKRTGQLEVLTEAVNVMRAGMAATLPGQPNYAGLLNNFGDILQTLFEKTGRLEVLTEAVNVDRAVVAATPAGHPDRAKHLSYLAGVLRLLFEHTEDLPLLAEIVEVLREAVAATPTDHRYRIQTMTNLGCALLLLFERVEDLRLLTEAVTVWREVVAATPPDTSKRIEQLTTFRIALQTLFERTNDLATLNELITVGRAAVAATPTSHPDRAGLLYNFSVALWELFERTGDLQMLAESVTIGGEAVTVIPTNHPNRTVILASHMVALGTLSRRTGELAMLTESVHVGQAMLSTASTDHRVQGVIRVGLVHNLAYLFERTGDREFLWQAVTLAKEIPGATLNDDPKWIAMTASLSCEILHPLFRRSGELAVWCEAGRLEYAAVEAALCLDDDLYHHPHSGRPPANPGYAPKGEYEWEALMAVLADVPKGTVYEESARRAIAAAWAAVATTPTGDPEYSGALTTYGNALRMLFDRTGKLTVLYETIRAARAAVVATPISDPDRGGYLNNLGTALRMLFERTGDLAAITEARESFSDAAASPASSVAVRITASRRLGDAAMLAGEPEAALAALETAVELMPQLVPRALSRSDREYILSQLSGLATEVGAAAVAANHPERAVELLEQTRGILLSEMIDARSDLTELRRAAPALAAEFDDLCRLIAAADDASPGPRDALKAALTTLTDTNIDIVRQAQPQRMTQLGEQRRQLAEQWTALVGRIRATAGFDQFLHPPLIGRLQRQATDGPIVIVYAGRHRADALIVTSDPSYPVQVVALPALTEDATAEQVNRLLTALGATGDEGLDIAGLEQAQREVHAVLGWLWDTITGPVLTHLSITDEQGPRPRIWWCPVGMLAYLPLHAAGHHTSTGSTPAPQTVLDRVVSSYVITLRALEHARAHRETPPANSAVIIAVPSAPDEPDLGGVADETDELARLLGSPRILTGAAATHQAVATELPQHRIAHFACHGLSDWTNPAASRLVLHDSNSAPLTVTALMRLHLVDADLAYLSACSTTNTSPNLTDEAVHLTSAVHLAGYRHVIGTLWPINDTAAARIATDVYSRLTDDGTETLRAEKSAYALAETIRKLRDDYPTLPTRWAAHLHVGP